MPHYLVVDGHSVIFALADLLSLHRRRPVDAREELVRRLRRLHDMGSWEVTVVFDGQSGRQGPAEKKTSGDLVVAYSKAGQTADSVIEALVAGQTAKVREAITVITADGGERATVEGLGAYCLSPDWLEAEIRSVAADFEEEFRRARKRWQKGS